MLKPKRTEEERDDIVVTKNTVSRINIRPSIDYFRGSIYEYDIVMAGFSMLRKANKLTEEELLTLPNEKKENRNIYIGNLMKENPELIDVVDKGLLKTLNKFLQLNDIQKNQIISVKRDSIFSTKKASVIQLKGGIDFRLANKFSGFFNFPQGIEMYYTNNINGVVNNITIKGLSDNKKEKHQFGIINLIKELLEIIEVNNNSNTLVDKLNKIKINYLNKVYPIEYYREFNRKSCFRSLESINDGRILFDELSEDFKEKIDVQYNYRNIILPIMSSVL